LKTSIFNECDAKNELQDRRYPVMWQYEDVKKTSSWGNWHNYDKEASDMLEDEYRIYVGNPHRNDVRAVKSGEYRYHVDFPNMKQINIDHDNHTQRIIRSIFLAKNYTRKS